MMDANTGFLKYCLDDHKPIPGNVKDIDWREMLRWAEQQAIVGIIYGGIHRVGKKLGIPFNVLMEWIGYASRIEAQSRLLNDRCVKVVKMFEDAGFKCCILKGQGNAVMYPQPLLRTPGDIDLYVLGNPIKGVLEFVRDKNPSARAIYHHIDMGIVDGVEVEVHYRPSFMNNLIYNRRLQRWFKMNPDCTNLTYLPDGVGEIPVLSWEFNAVFQLCHIYQHVIKEGIGFRQMIDYYQLLRNAAKLEIRNEKLEMTLRHLGLWKFAGAVMYVMELFGLEEQCMIAPVDEKRGKVLLNEILKGGNFGKYDEANVKANSQLKKNIQRIRRDIRMMRYFPSECLWEPIFRIYHFFWRRKWN